MNERLTRKTKLKPIRKSVLFFSFQYQVFETTVLKDIAFGPVNFGVETQKKRETAKLMGIEELLDRSPSRCREDS